MARKTLEAVRFEVPFDSDPPLLTSAAVGLPRVLQLASASYTMDVTVFDAPDGRLLRAGVTVAHRVVDGRGEWYLSAPDWEPHLPGEQVAPIGAQGEAPERFRRLVQPLTRGVALAPMATMVCERSGWALRGDSGEVAATVRDDRVEVRREDRPATQYREFSVMPTEHLTGQQLEYLLSAVRAVDATVVADFPSIRQRIGAPATGLTGFVTPRELERDATLEEFVSTIFAGHLGAIVRADLDRRAGDLDELGGLNDRLWVFGRDLRGLAPVLEPAWREDVERLLTELPYETPADIEQPTLAVIDALVVAVRAPRLGDQSQHNAAVLLFERAQHATYILGERCGHLTEGSPSSQWQGALRAAQQLEVSAHVLAPLMRKSMTKLLSHLDDVLIELRACAKDTFDGEPELDGLSPTQAYQLGLEYERARGQARNRRRDFVTRWPKRVKEARALLAKAQKKQQKRLERRKA